MDNTIYYVSSKNKNKMGKVYKHLKDIGFEEDLMSGYVERPGSIVFYPIGETYGTYYHTEPCTEKRLKVKDVMEISSWDDLKHLKEHI